MPPLHLAIMIAKDSPLLIDCPMSKKGGISSAHADLDAAVAKFRMTAYMWQALTAEDMRSKGLGRRSFRLEEEWAVGTLSREFLNAAHESSPDYSRAIAMRSTAKVHLIRTEKTVSELRDAQIAQQNPQALRKGDLHSYFSAALKAYGGPLASSAHPVVAGLILDSTFSTQQDLLLAHTALGSSNPSGISLGMFGSHLTYSWPRFVEEVTACLLDTTPPGDGVANDCGECGTLWEACSIGQGAFLHEVGHAFGAPHTTGIMARGYSQHWPRVFLTQTAYCAAAKAEGFIVIDCKTENGACWDIRDALAFKVLPHFRLANDPVLTRDALVATPQVELLHEDGELKGLAITSKARIARIQFKATTETVPSVSKSVVRIEYAIADLESRFDRTIALDLHILGMNGKE